MFLVLNILLLVILLVILCLCVNFLRHSFQANKKGLPPYVNTFRSDRSLLREQLHIPVGATILDLGCSDGTMLRLFTKWFHPKKAVGYDINPLAIRRGKVINRITHKHHVKLIHDDIYNADVSGYDYIYLYLLPNFIEKLEPRLFDHIDAGTIVICNTFPFAAHQPFETIKDNHGKERLFLYRK